MQQIKFKLPDSVRLLFGFGISGVLLYLMVRQSGIEWKHLTLNNTQWAYFSISIAAFIFGIWLQSVRAKFMWINQRRRYRDIDTYSGFIVGNFYNCVLPANLGDGVRAYHFSQKHKVPFLQSLAMIITEKWIDALIFIFYVVLVFTVKPFISHTVSNMLLLVAIVAAILWVLYAFMRRYRKLEKRLWYPVLFLTRKPGRLLYKLYKYTIAHIQQLHNNRYLAYYILLGLVVFILNNLQFYFLMKTVGIESQLLSIYTAFLIGVSTMVIALIPSAPSNIGVVHYGTYLVFLFAAAVYQITPTSEDLTHYALFGVYMHLSYFIPEILIGIFYVIMEREILFNKKIPNIWHK